MRLLSSHNTPQSAINNPNNHLKGIIEAYNESMRHHASLRAALEQALDECEREAELNLNAAKEQLYYVEKMRREIGDVELPPPERQHIVAPIPMRMEASTWRWFHEVSGDRSSIRNSFGTGTTSKGPESESDSAMSQDTSYEKPFDYISMKNEGTTSFVDSGPPSHVAEDSVASSGLMGSIDSLASNLSYDAERSSDHPNVHAGGLCRPSSQLVTVNRESLATLLNAFDQILLNGTI